MRVPATQLELLRTELPAKFKEHLSFLLGLTVTWTLLISSSSGSSPLSSLTLPSLGFPPISLASLPQSPLWLFLPLMKPECDCVRGPYQEPHALLMVLSLNLWGVPPTLMTVATLRDCCHHLFISNPFALLIPDLSNYLSNFSMWMVTGMSQSTSLN